MQRRISAVALFLTMNGALLSAQPRWTVDPKPILDIKGVNDAGAIVFGTANWATRMANGTIVIADGATPAVQFIDGTGKPIKSAGRSGQGPGDFRALTWIAQCAKDTVFAWDFAQMRITTYDAAGMMLRTFPFGVPGGPQFQSSCNTSGMMALFGSPRRVPPSTPPDPNAGYAIMSMAATAMIIGPKGDTMAKLGEIPLVDYIGSGRGGGAMPRPLGPATAVAVGTNRVYVSRGDSSAIAVYALDGKRTGSIPLRVPDRTPTAAQYARAAEVILAMAPAASRERARVPVMAAPIPSKLPLVTGLFIDPAGLVWALLSSPGDSDTRLRAFRADGTAVADATLPVNLNVFEIGADYILGSHSDVDDETHVVVYRLRRGR